jgi:hypothetical protein
MLRTVYGDPKRYVDQYWSQIPGMYFTGDGARKDKDGNFWIMGRIDDVINVSGHRLSTMEVESALVAHNKVAEAAVVARLDDLKGQAIAAFVTLKSGIPPTPELKEELRMWVTKEIGSLAKPDDIRFTDSLPKTRSGKIMRRLLKEIAAGGGGQGRHHYYGRSLGGRQTQPAGRVALVHLRAVFHGFRGSGFPQAHIIGCLCRAAAADGDCRPAERPGNRQAGNRRSIFPTHPDRITS